MSIKELRHVTEMICLAFVAGFVLGGAVLKAADKAVVAAEADETVAVAASPAENTAPLNTAPQAEVVVPPGRPEWVERIPVRKFQGTDETTVCSDPFSTREACLPALDEKIAVAVMDYITEVTGSKLAPNLLAYDLPSIKEHLVPRQNYYEETIVSPSVGPMHQIHARVQFDENFRREISDRWLQIRSAARLGQVGLAFIAILSVLATVAGFFRVDNASRGYYTGRLQWVAAGAILGLIVLGAFVARLIPWI